MTAIWNDVGVRAHFEASATHTDAARHVVGRVAFWRGVQITG